MEEPRTRRAVVADATAVAVMVELAYAPYVARIGRRPAPMDQDYERVIRSADVWVAEVGGRVVGVAVAYLRTDHALLENVAVHPQAQHAGVGTMLLRTAEHHAAQHGRAEMRLYTNEDMTENLDYYPRRGCRRTHAAVEDGFRRIYFAKPL